MIEQQNIFAGRGGEILLPVAFNVLLNRSFGGLLYGGKVLR